MTKKVEKEQSDDGWPELLSVVEAAAFLRLKRSTLDHYRCEGRGPIYRKHGARVFYPKPSLIRWSERNSYASTSERIGNPNEKAGSVDCCNRHWSGPVWGCL